MEETFAKAFNAKSQQCPLRLHWVSFRLVDEFGRGEPYAGLSYEIFDTSGKTYTGVLDSKGYGRIENIYCGPLRLTLPGPYTGGVDTWYERLMIRDYYALPITALQVAAEQTLRRPAEQPSPGPALAAQESAEFYRVEVRDLVEVTSHLPPASTTLAPRPSKMLAANARQDKEVPTYGVALSPNRHHVLEVKALRAWRPLLSLTPEFSALDAYQLLLFTVLAYAGFGQKYEEGQALPPTYPVPGTIGHVLNACLSDIQTGALYLEPGRFADAMPYHFILEEVPYSRRLEVVPYDPQRYTRPEERKLPWELHSLDDTDTNTQAYITHDDRMVLIAIRGTQENPPDLLRDIDAAQVPYVEGLGQAHKGFYEAFLAVKKLVTPYLRNFYTGQKIVVCGHSLGGAIALLLAEWIRRDKQLNADVLLYTYGAPRAGDKAFVEGAAELVHHRLVNHNDPIPSLPGTWMDTDKRLWIPGAAALITGASTGIGAAVFLAGVVNLKGPSYWHHGTQHHFLPLPLSKAETTSVLWQPGCKGIEEAACAYYAAKVTEAEMPDRSAFIAQLLSMSQHFTVNGYLPACHATLLRWIASAADQGNRLTERERQWLEREIASYQGNLEAWERQARRYRESGAPSDELQALERAIEQSAQERSRLPYSLGRIRELARQPVTRRQIFGAQAERFDLAQLLARWQAHEENQPARTPHLARLPRPLPVHFV